MQQHTGQHLLSAAFERHAEARTMSFHLGASASTIDLNKELSADQIARVEDEANRIIWEDREVCVKFATASEAATLPLRKEPARDGELRIIEIKDYDLSACGGTHVSRTGAIGIVAVSGFERFKGGLRVEFVCGGRALQSYRALDKAVSASVRLLSVLPEDLPSAIEKLQTSARTQQKAQDALMERLAVHEAESLASDGEKVGPATLVAAAVAGWDPNGLKRLASSIAGRPATIAVLLGSESPSPIVVARSQDLSIDAGVILKKLIERFGGKGGGKGGMAQGGGLTGEPRLIIEAARDVVKSALADSQIGRLWD
jgi:alanyl-tRNA synthetase